MYLNKSHMPIAKLEFDLDKPEDRESFRRAMKADSLAWAIDDIWTNVFRPAHKHGYPAEYVFLQDLSLRDLEIIEGMANIYRKVLEDYHVTHEDLS